MSLSFAQKQASAANAKSSNAIATKNQTAEEADDDQNFMFKMRTFDVFWVDKSSLMHRDGYAKTFDKVLRKATRVAKQKSSIPLILRDMAPPLESIFDPAAKWEEEQEIRRLASQAQAQADAAAAALKEKKKGKKNTKGKAAADTIKENNQLEKARKELDRDVQKLSNCRSLKAVQDASCDTMSGKIHRMVKLLHFAVSDLKQGSTHSSEAEVLDILWALEGMQAYKEADALIDKEKAYKKQAKEVEKDKKSSKKDSKKESKKSSKKDKKESKSDVKLEKVVLNTEAQSLKDLYKEGGDGRGSYKDSLKFARKIMKSKSNLITFQLTDMPDRLPPLSRYNRQFKLEEWQCDILGAIDQRQSAVVCAPTSSGKTLLSTYTCKVTPGTVLFVLPTEALVWQIAATYYRFFHGNVTICTDQVSFQEISGDTEVYIGTPRALEKALTKARGCAGQEMAKGEKEFTILDGGYKQFEYLVLDEVHTLNGPEGDALQRIFKSIDCPFLALSATIGNAEQLQSWLSSVRNQHVEARIIDAPIKKEEVILKEHFARFINLQRYVVSETLGKDGKKKCKLVKLHPVAAMTPERLAKNPELVSGLSMTPTDMINIWRRIKSIFPSDSLEDMDDPDNFFASQVDDSNRITLNQTKDYELRLKMRLTALSKSHPDLYANLCKSQLPPELEKKSDVSEMLYGVIEQLKTVDLLPAVAFQLDTYGAFNMFKTLLATLEREQLDEFPSYRDDLIKTAREKAQMRKVAAGRADRVNAAEAEEEAKSGFTDDLDVNEDTTRPHERYVLTPPGKRLTYTEVEDIISDMKKAGERVDINHALIRGLRRGVAIYTNEVGFSCYRRQVQMLAQKGRLAVVFSDAALAYGVNMPFRTCLFCGDMGDKLTPLIAQQMQGRAGRRGMDVQGNVIYLGMEWSYIENLMLGQISQVTGKQPRYPTMALQLAIAQANDPRDLNHFVHDHDGETDGVSPFANAIRKIQRSQQCFPTLGEDTMKMMTDTTLAEFCEEKEDNQYFGISHKVIEGLGYVDSELRLKMDHNVLSMVFEMGHLIPEAIHLCATLEQLYFNFCYNKTKSFKESDGTQNDFLAVLLHVIDRVPAKEGEDSLQQYLRLESTGDTSKIVDESASNVWKETEEILRAQRNLIESFDIPQSEKDKMHIDVVPGPEGTTGPPLDRGVYEMIVLKQKGFRDDQDYERRNELKDRVVKLGQICLIAHNNLQQPHGKYDALEVHFRRLFNNIKYSVSDMMTQLTDQPDLTLI